MQWLSSIHIIEKHNKSNYKCDNYTSFVYVELM